MSERQEKKLLLSSTNESRMTEEQGGSLGEAIYFGCMINSLPGLEGVGEAAGASG